ncbi:MAG: hypothetical protein ABEJ70_01645 [Halobacteriaceae archaeon]
MGDEALDGIGAARTVLLLASRRERRGDEICGRLLSPAPASELGVIYVTLMHPPAHRVEHWDEYGCGPPADLVVVAAGNAADRDADAATDYHVRRLPDPSNLTKLGVAMTESLDEVADHTPVVCFHSLSILLQYVNVEQAFQFVSVLGHHFESAGARGHFHMDPKAHDEQTLATLEQVFDAIVELEDGEYSVIT